MPQILLSPPPSMPFPLHSPIQLFLLPATFAPPYKYPSTSTSTSRSTSSLRSSSKPSFFPTSFPYSIPHQNPNQEPAPTRNQNQDQEDEEDDDEDDDGVLGDCLVFEEGAFEDDIAHIRSRSAPTAPAPESLVPERWKEIVEEINLTKKEKRKISHELKFGSKLERRKKSPEKDAEEYIAYRDLKLSQLKPVVLDDPKEFLSPVGGDSLPEPPPEGRVAPRNPKSGLAKRSLEDISKFFSSGRYVPGEMDDDDKKPRSQRKLFTPEEKVLLNKRIPNLVEATSSKWLPLHTLAASGEFYLLDTLLKHNVDINAVDKDGLAAIHKAILCKKQAIINFLLRNSANPFIRDQDGATLIHYAVQTASSQTIKILVLYNVDINLPDHDGWTPLHLAVQIQRTDIVRLLLIKGADRNLKNRDGLMPLELCFYLGHDMRTYELIKLLKGLPMPKPVH